jgi:hypothetical protein
VTSPSLDPVLLPPDIESLARTYLLAALAPTPIATRMPAPPDAAITINGLLRVEYGGGSKPNPFQYDAQCLLHGYHPNEIVAKQITGKALALMGAARGHTVVDTLGNGWYVVGVFAMGLPQRLTDPDVNLPRFRSAVTWRVVGQPWTP